MSGPVRLRGQRPDQALRRPPCPPLTRKPSRPRRSCCRRGEPAHRIIDRPCPTDDAAALRQAYEAAHALLGETVPVLPQITLPAGTTTPAEAIAATTVAGATAGQDPPTWLSRIARVRPNVAALETMSCCAELLRTDASPQTLSIGQLPLGTGQPSTWVGLPHAPIEGVHTSLAFVGPPPQTGAPFTGLLIDEWVETIPAIGEVGGVAFHYDAPTAQPPAALLLVVPPASATGNWSLDDLTRGVDQLLTLATARYAGPADLDGAGGDLRQFLPAAYLPSNESDPAGIARERLFVADASYGQEIDAANPQIASLATGIRDQQGNAGARQGATVEIDVTGAALSGASFSITPPNGVTIVAQTVNGPTAATVSLKVAPNAALEPRMLTATTATAAAVGRPLPSSQRRDSSP